MHDIPPAYLMMGDGVHDPIDSAFAPFLLQKSLGDLAVSYELKRLLQRSTRHGTALYGNALECARYF